MGDANKSPRVQVQRAERHAEWLALFTSGATYRQIAERNNVAVSTVHEAIHRQLGAARDRRDGLADVALELQIARYEWLWAQTVASLAASKAGREVGRSQLISAGRQVLDSMTKLMGLDQPQRAEVTVHTVSDIDREISGLAAMLREKARADAAAAGVDPETPVLDALAEGAEPT